MRDVLVRMEQAKDELEKMQRRLDVILAVSEENWENRKKRVEPECREHQGWLCTAPG